MPQNHPHVLGRGQATPRTSTRGLCGEGQSLSENSLKVPKGPTRDLTGRKTSAPHPHATTPAAQLSTRSFPMGSGFWAQGNCASCYMGRKIFPKHFVRLLVWGTLFHPHFSPGKAAGMLTFQEKGKGQ